MSRPDVRTDDNRERLTWAACGAVVKCPGPGPSRRRRPRLFALREIADDRAAHAHT